MEILLILTVLPSILLGWYIYKNDKIEKEPTGLLIKLFLSGLGSIVITLVVSSVIDLFVPFDLEESHSIPAIFIYVFLAIALVEEGSKYIMVRANTWNSPEYKHVYDGIVYCVFVSLGFATLENFLYIFESLSLSTAIFRGIMAVPGHVFDAIAMGQFYGLAKEAEVKGNIKDMNKYNLLSIAIPVLLHGIYDSCLFAENDFLVLFFFAFLIFLYIYSFKTVGKIAKVPYNFTGSTPIYKMVYNPQINQMVYQNNQINNVVHDIYCSNCGTKYEGNFCAKCGNRRN